MTGFALFRLPYGKECTLLTGNVLTFPSCAELGGQQGFVMAPFAPSVDNPILLIQPERTVETESLELRTERYDYLLRLTGNHTSQFSVLNSQLSDYHIDFANFHAHLLNGDFQKLVLSRSIDIKRTGDDTPLDLFRKACDRYPRLMISLVYTERSGLWLAATPEVLLAGSGDEWQTMALTGTMPFSDDVRWSDKNIQEQRYVATYITEQLEQFTDSFTEEGPYTVRAGHLAHLRSDFRFTLFNNARVGELLQALHPTPAVCGLPKQEAFRFILQNEHHDRSYYSGFMGPFFVAGQTHLFVTLRCMQIFVDAYRLYAGGGLLKDSDEEQEWLETETKLDTMRRLIYNS